MGKLGEKQRRATPWRIDLGRSSGSAPHIARRLSAGIRCACGDPSGACIRPHDIGTRSVRRRPLTSLRPRPSRAERVRRTRSVSLDQRAVGATRRPVDEDRLAAVAKHAGRGGRGLQRLTGDPHASALHLLGVGHVFAVDPALIGLRELLPGLLVAVDHQHVLHGGVPRSHDDRLRGDRQAMKNKSRGPDR